MGCVVFIGAGPGAADLITVRGAQRLARAEVVLFDALTDPELRAHAPSARWIDVGKRGFEHSAAQADIDAMLVALARQHDLVVRLKGGDPGIFGRLDEELLAVRRAGIACEVVPGVSAALGAAAALQRPLTRRGLGRSVALATAMTRDGAGPTSRHADTEVFYMAGRQLGTLSRHLVEKGWPAHAPAYVVSRAAWPDQLSTELAVGDLAQAAELHAGRPTVVVVGVGATPLGDGATVDVVPLPHDHQPT